MAALSNTTRKVLEALADDDQTIIITVRRSTTAEWSARVQGPSARFAVRITTFRMLRRTGLIAKAREWEVFGLIYAAYELTDAARAALEVT